MIDKFLPIGSVVLLKKGTKKVMITGYAMKDGRDNQLYDYVATIFPEGIFDPSMNILFNHEDILKMYHMGYCDGEYEVFRQLIANSMIELRKEPTSEVTIDTSSSPAEMTQNTSGTAAPVFAPGITSNFNNYQ